jgi:hypothetical protein
MHAAVAAASSRPPFTHPSQLISKHLLRQVAVCARGEQEVGHLDVVEGQGLEGTGLRALIVEHGLQVL